MTDQPEGAVKWFLRYVFVPLAVVVLGAGATYYFTNRDALGGESAGAQTNYVSSITDSPTNNIAEEDEIADDRPPPPKPQAQMEQLIRGADYPGDLMNQGENLANAEACRSKCLVAQDCRAMTYIEEPFAGHNAGECWLKSSAGPPQSNPYTSGAKKILPEG